MLLVALLLAFSFPEATRPDPLPDETGCDHYKGTSSGNDPSVTLDVVLCPHEDGTEGKVQGKVQWSSLLSGWNLRKVEGTWVGDELSMRDLEIIEERPESGFRFCTIDTYDLEKKSSGTLEGTYRSKECDDNANVTLEPVADPTGRDGPPARPEDGPEAGPPGPDDAPAKDADDDPDNKRNNKPNKSSEKEASGNGCGCDVTLLFTPLLGLGLRRRRRRGSTTRAQRPSVTRFSR